MFFFNCLLTKTTSHMWPSQAMLLQLCKYRSMNKVIIQNMYDEWLEKKCHSIKVTLSVSSETLDKDIETFLENSDGFAFVEYQEPHIHVALLMSREAHGVEYVDCMASPKNEEQKKFESKCKDICKKIGKRFTGSEELFGGILHPYDDTYVFSPPQAAEQQFVGYYNYSPHEFYKTIYMFEEKEGKWKYYFDTEEQDRMIFYAERYSAHDGGDCVFWASHVASEVQKLDVSAYDWFRKQDWFEIHYPTKRVYDDIFRVGSHVLKYVTTQIFESLLQCSKSSLKHLS